MSDPKQRAPFQGRPEGFYWVRFPWGWEPAKWDGYDWLRFDHKRYWNEYVVEIGQRLNHLST